MIDKETNIIPGMLVRHDEGLTYRIDHVGDDTRDYETTGKIGGAMIGYTQLDDGHYPGGKGWSKPEEGFRQYFTPEQETPDWAPVISSNVNLGNLFDNISIDYLALGKLLEEQGLPKDELKNLWINLSLEPFWIKFGGLPQLGSFLSKTVLNSTIGEKYKDFIQSELPGITEKDLDEKSFIFINVELITAIALRNGKKPAGELRSTLIHEILHFIEYISDTSSEMADLLRNPVFNEYKIYDRISAEEQAVATKHRPLIESGRFNSLITTGLRRALADSYSSSSPR